MTSKELEKYSTNVKSQARKLLRSTKLLDILEKHGHFHLIGSYPLDIMYGPDIDIIVETENPRKSSVEALQEIVDKELFRKVEYGDFVKFPMDKRPEGYILVLKAEVEGVKWEIEVWFLEDASKQLNYNKSLKSIISKENRLKILEAKYKRDISKISKHKLSSYEIYEQILGKITI